MRSLLTIGMLLVVVGGFTLGAPGASNALAATTNVSVEDNQYVPPSVTLSVGDTVHWTWGGANPHTVTATDTSFDSGAPQTSGTFDHTFNTAGTFTYFCQVHGAQAMSGTVVVQEAAAPTSTTQPAASATSPPAATSTAATAAASATPGVASTATARVSAAPGAPTAIAVAPATTGSGGAAGAGASLPRAGTGGAGADLPMSTVLPLILAIAGAVSIVLAIAARRRA